MPVETVQPYINWWYFFYTIRTYKSMCVSNEWSLNVKLTIKRIMNHLANHAVCHNLTNNHKSTKDLNVCFIVVHRQHS